MKRILKLAEYFYKLAKQKPFILFHGTPPSKLKSILSAGLLQNPKKRSWAEDPDAGLHNPSRISLGGVYFTSNLMTAISSCTNAANRGAQTRGIIIAEVQPSELILDEDNITHLLHRIVMMGWTVNEMAVSELYMDYLINGENGSHFKEGKFNYISHKMGEIKNRALGCQVHIVPALEDRLVDLLEEGYLAALRRKAAYADEWNWKRAYYGLAGNNADPNKIPQIPNKNEAEKEYGDFVNKITATLKSKLHPKDLKNEFNFTARVMKDVGFNRKSKILAILDINDKSIDGEYIAEVNVLYPSSWQNVKLEAREEFENQWKSRMGSKLIFNK